MISSTCRNCSIVQFLVFASLLGAARPTSAQNDPAVQFSPISNPNLFANGKWSYGYENFPLPNPFNLLTLPGPVSGVDAWRSPAFGEVGVYHNGTAAAVNFVTPLPDNAIYQAGELGMHPGPNDQYGVVQFTPAAAGFYKIHGVFEGLDLGGTNTLVNLLWNNVSVAGGNVLGFGPGSDVPLSFGPVFLNVNDTLAYAVGGNPIRGSTGLLNASVDAVAPEPNTFVLSGLGLIGFLAYVQRRKRPLRLAPAARIVALPTGRPAWSVASGKNGSASIDLAESETRRPTAFSESHQTSDSSKWRRTSLRASV